jgi:hypothetical protein
MKWRAEDGSRYRPWRGKENAMLKAEFDALCRGVAKGDNRIVEEESLNRIGRVEACEGNHLRVETEGAHESWPSEVCRERFDLSLGEKS